MPALYDPLDNIPAAESLLEKIQLEAMDLISTLEYEAALDPEGAGDDPTDYDKSNYYHLRSIERLKEALVEYLKDKRP